MYIFALYLTNGYYLVSTDPLLLILSLYLIGSWAFRLLSCVPPVTPPLNRTTGLAFLILILAAVFSWMCFITSPLALSVLTALGNYPRPLTACPDDVPSAPVLDGGWGRWGLDLWSSIPCYYSITMQS